MFGIDSSELLVIALVALVVIGPKDLPRVMRTVGQFVGRARGMAKHFRTGLDAMVRESELEEMDKKWKAENARIMQAHPASAPGETWAEPVLAEPAPPPPPLPPQQAGRIAARPKPPPRARSAPRRAAVPAPRKLPPETEAP
jgi:sec-independent protein translocase protein TatB